MSWVNMVAKPPKLGIQQPKKVLSGLRTGIKVGKFNK